MTKILPFFGVLLLFVAMSALAAAERQAVALTQDVWRKFILCRNGPLRNYQMRRLKHCSLHRCQK